MKNAILIGAALAGLGGCGGGGSSGEAFVGVYQVSSHRRNYGQGVYIACSDAGAEVAPASPFYAPYFALIVDPFFEDPAFIRFQECTGSDLATCTDVFGGLMTPGGPGLLDESPSSSVSGGNCSLYANRTTFALDEGTGVGTFEDRHWDDFSQPEPACEDLDNAEALIGTPDCREVSIWVGTRMQP